MNCRKLAGFTADEWANLDGIRPGHPSGSPRLANLTRTRVRARILRTAHRRLAHACPCNPVTLDDRTDRQGASCGSASPGTNWDPSTACRSNSKLRTTARRPTLPEPPRCEQSRPAGNGVRLIAGGLQRSASASEACRCRTTLLAASICSLFDGTTAYHTGTPKSDRPSSGHRWRSRSTRSRRSFARHSRSPRASVASFATHPRTVFSAATAVLCVFAPKCFAISP